MVPGPNTARQRWSSRRTQNSLPSRSCIISKGSESSVARGIAAYIVGQWALVPAQGRRRRPEEAGGPTRLRKPVVRLASCRTKLDRLVAVAISASRPALLGYPRTGCLNEASRR